VVEFLKFLTETYAQHGCQGLIDLGDLTDDRQAIPIPTIHCLLEGLGSEVFSGGHNIKLVGNHEQWLRSPEIHPGIMYKQIFRVVQESQVILCPRDNVAFACISFIDDKDRLSQVIQETVREAQATKARVVLLGHFTLNGAKTHTTITGGVSAQDIPSFELALLGHIHKHQRIGTKIFYVGSPFQQDFGEAGDHKYVGILDTTTMAVQWIPTRLPKYHRVGIQDFVDAVKPDTEDRFEVRLTSPEEATQFYAHPLAGRATPVYTYETAQQEASIEDVGSLLSPHALLEEYLKGHPPEAKGLKLQADELLYCGRELLGAH
jgi:hypothetical protein